MAAEKKSFIRKIPGFRSGKWWKMILATIGYFFIVIFILALISPSPPKENNINTNATQTSQESAKVVTCTPDWQCSTWSDCSSSGTQTRTCTDKNACNTTTSKPQETQTCTPAPVVEEYPCPDLSGMKLQGYSSGFQSWIAEVSPYKSNNVEVVYTYTTGGKIIYCDAGSTEGQNANWVYCGDSLRPIVAQYTDSSGTIINKRSVEVTFDKNTNQYLATKCDTYELM